MLRDIFSEETREKNETHNGPWRKRPTEMKWNEKTESKIAPKNISSHLFAPSQEIKRIKCNTCTQTPLISSHRLLACEKYHLCLHHTLNGERCVCERELTRRPKQKHRREEEKTQGFFSYNILTLCIINSYKSVHVCLLVNSFHCKTIARSDMRVCVPISVCVRSLLRGYHFICERRKIYYDVFIFSQMNKEKSFHFAFRSFARLFHGSNVQGVIIIIHQWTETYSVFSFCRKKETIPYDHER